MFTKIFSVISKIVKSSLLIYVYDTFTLGLNVFVPINFLTVSVVYIFGIYGILAIIFLSILI